LQKFRRNKHL